MARNDEEDPKESAMLPAKIRGQSPEVIDRFVAAKMEKFAEALDFSDAGQDPVRRAIALENLKLAIDPRINQAEVRSRSTALLNTIRVLGMDRDTTKISTDKQSVEQALQRLREAAERGIHAAGRTIQQGVSGPSATLPSGQEVLLREPPERNLGKVPVGPIRTTLPDSGKDTKRNRQRPGGRKADTIDYPQGEETQD